MGPTRVPVFGLEQIVLMISAFVFASATSAVIALLHSALHERRDSFARRRQDKLAQHLSDAVERDDWARVESVARKALRHRQRIRLDRSLEIPARYDEVRRILDGPDAIIAWFPVTTRHIGSETEMTFDSKNHVRVQMSWDPTQACLVWTAEDEEAHVPFRRAPLAAADHADGRGRGDRNSRPPGTESSRRVRDTLHRWLPSLERGLSDIRAELAS